MIVSISGKEELFPARMECYYITFGIMYNLCKITISAIEKKPVQ